MKTLKTLFSGPICVIWVASMLLLTGSNLVSATEYVCQSDVLWENISWYDETGSLRYRDFPTDCFYGCRNDSYQGHAACREPYSVPEQGYTFLALFFVLVSFAFFYLSAQIKNKEAEPLSIMFLFFGIFFVAAGFGTFMLSGNEGLIAIAGTAMWLMFLVVVTFLVFYYVIYKTTKDLKKRREDGFDE